MYVLVGDPIQQSAVGNRLFSRKREETKSTEKHSFGKITSSSPLDLDIREDQPFKMVAPTPPACEHYGGAVHTSLVRTDEALGHKFRIGNCDATKSDVDKRFAIGARLLNEMQKIPMSS